MKLKKMILSLIVITTALADSAFALYDKNILDEIAVSKNDIPEGFVFGLIPKAVKSTLKDNPWHFDSAAVQKLTNKIYPDGDYRRVSDIHITIIANEKKPYGDDMVCYMILFKDTVSAKSEIAKLSRYVGFNSDRAVLFVKDNLAVFLHADDTDDFDRLNDLADKISSKIK